MVGFGIRRASLRGLAVLGVLAVGHPLPVPAYTGGPVRVRLLGYDPTEAKVFYSLSFHDESGSQDQFYYMQLDGPNPDAAIRVPSLEQEHGKSWSPEIAKRWWNIHQRLLLLRAPKEFNYSISVEAESLGVVSYLGVDSTRYRIHVALQSAVGAARLDTLAYCHPEVSVKGLYDVPDRRESIVVVSVIGRSYGCEQTDVVLLIRPREP